MEIAAALEEREFEEEDIGDGLQMEGLETRTDHIRARAAHAEEEEEEEYEEEAPVVKRRPIIEIQ